MRNESQQNGKPRRHIVAARGRQDETNDVRIVIENGKEEKKNKSSQHQQIRIRQARKECCGGVAPRRNREITE